MTEMLHWYAETSGGVQTGNCTVTENGGALHLTADLPAGTLKTVRAEMPWTMEADERLFMNGYQTWTYSPELDRNGKLRGIDHIPGFLRKKYAFDRYGDYHFAPYGHQKGQSHGFSYCYFRKGGQFQLVASLDETPGYTILRYDSGKALLTLERDCAGVKHPGGSFSLFDLFFAEGSEAEYDIVYDASAKVWSVKQMTETYVYDRYAAPSKEHWLGTDTNGMDMLTRLMYGGRVSLIIGFIVVVIEASLGILMGGISGYFGGWIDNIIMRIVDVFYCIPSMPVIIIIGAAMDAMRVDSWKRMMYLMLILGFLGWPSIARLVRGQILSLREQEFMLATEACGIKVWHRIFRHLIPNVIPQLIVNCTMSLGSTIITEATLSFLGLGVKFPFASWGNIMNDVSNSYVLTSYWFIWIPAGICLMLTVLGFNFVGDGLRDALDPKLKK